MLYIFSLILLFVLGLITPKTKEKENLIENIVITTIIILAYNTFICFFLNIINIPITLTTLAIVNIIISALLIYNIIKQKKLQDFEIKIKDSIACIVILIITITTIGINTNCFTSIHYLGMDPLQHYKAAREFLENDTLSNKYSEQYTTSNSHMPMGYVNIGILFKIFKSMIGLISIYRIYLIFETMIYALTGIMFYFCINKNCKSKNQYIISLIFSVIYVIGYPLNALIAGFHYLIIGILFFTAIFYAIKNIVEKERIKFTYNVILLMLLNIGLMFSYALFCPPVYLAELIYFFYKYKQNKSKKQLLLYILFVLIITGLMGCSLILYENIKEIGTTGIKLDGWIYKNDWSNFILFIPFSIYYIFINIKEKNEHTIFEKSLFIIFTIYYIALAVGKEIGLCSSYYSYKNSYIIWLIILYTSVYSMQKLINSKEIKRYIVNIFTASYCFLLIISVFFMKTYIEIGPKQAENITTLMDIFSLNITNININYSYLSKEEIELINKLNTELNDDWNNNSTSILIIGDPTQEQWLYAFTGYFKNSYKNIVQCVIDWNSQKYEYLIVLKNRETYQKLKLAISEENAQIIYENKGRKNISYTERKLK